MRFYFMKRSRKLFVFEVIFMLLAGAAILFWFSWKLLVALFLWSCYIQVMTKRKIVEDYE